MKLPIWSIDVHLAVYTVYGCVCGMNVCVIPAVRLIFVGKKTETNWNEKITCAHFVNIFELLSLGIHACKAYKRACYILAVSFVCYTVCWLFQAITLKGALSALKLNEWTIRSE